MKLTNYLGIYNLFKNSREIKTDICEAAETLNISVYSLSRLTGTSFISHHHRALTHLLSVWPVIVVALKNTIVAWHHKVEIKATITRFLKQLKDYQTLCNTCAYLAVLEKMSPVALILEEENLLSFGVKPLIKQCLLELKDFAECTGEPDEMFVSHFNRFLSNEHNNGNQSLSASFAKFGHML